VSRNGRRKKLLIGAVLFAIVAAGIYCWAKYRERIALRNGADFNWIIGGILRADDPDEELFAELVTGLINGDAEEYRNAADQLSPTLDLTSLSEVVTEGKRDYSTPYRGIFLGDIRDARWVLAHVDQVKAAGIDTLLFNVHYLADASTGELYVAGEETYLFYLNAFHQSGFRVWIQMSHAAYEFPYRWNSPSEHIDIPKLENQEDILEMVLPEMYRWAEIAEKFNADVFIPMDEANSLLITEDYPTTTGLCKPEREQMSAWMQEILPKIKERFSGKIGFASNDGSGCEGEGVDHGFEFDYTGYDFIVFKIPFPSIFNYPDWTWDQHMDSMIGATLPVIDEYDLDGVLFYEVGDTVGAALREDFAGMLPVNDSDESHQQEIYEKDVALLDKSNKILGLFFKISAPQPHEPSWNPFDRPAEDVLKDNFTQYGTLALTETDKLWIAVGEDGLKAIQICLSEDMPFDPDYSLDWGYGEEKYKALISNVKAVCRRSSP
jgi:hypothetical protein